jgi:hypothetical protein
MSYYAGCMFMRKHFQYNALNKLAMLAFISFPGIVSQKSGKSSALNIQSSAYVGRSDSYGEQPSCRALNGTQYTTTQDFLGGLLCSQ